MKATADLLQQNARRVRAGTKLINKRITQLNVIIRRHNAAINTQRAKVEALLGNFNLTSAEFEMLDNASWWLDDRMANLVDREEVL